MPVPAAWHHVGQIKTNFGQTLNGKIAWAVSWDPLHYRWVVRVKSGDDYIYTRVKEQNLRPYAAIPVVVPRTAQV